MGIFRKYNLKGQALHLIVALCIMTSGLSCLKEDTWQTRRDQLIGSWSGTGSLEKTYKGGSKTEESVFILLDIINTELAIYAQNSSSFPVSTTVNYLYQPDPEKIVFSRKNSFMPQELSTPFSIIKNTAGKQVWENNYQELFIDPITNNLEFIDVQATWELERN